MFSNLVNICWLWVSKVPSSSFHKLVWTRTLEDTPLETLGFSRVLACLLSACGHLDKQTKDKLGRTFNKTGHKKGAQQNKFHEFLKRRVVNNTGMVHDGLEWFICFFSLSYASHSQKE